MLLLASFSAVAKGSLLENGHFVAGKTAVRWREAAILAEKNEYETEMLRQKGKEMQKLKGNGKEKEKGKGKGKGNRNSSPISSSSSSSFSSSSLVRISGTAPSGCVQLLLYGDAIQVGGTMLRML